MLKLLGSLFSKDEEEPETTILQQPPPRSRSKSPVEDGLPSELRLKILVIGGSGVGKTSIIRRYTQDVFSKHYIPTIGIDLFSKIIYQETYLHLPQTIVLQFCDIAHQEVGGRNLARFFEELAGIIVVFDSSCLQAHKYSLAAVEQWYSVIIDQVGMRTLTEGLLVPEVPMALFANKSDLATPVFTPEKFASVLYCLKFKNLKQKIIIILIIYYYFLFSYFYDYYYSAEESTI
jgi:GTPase SAR1 family protein